jgi:hypothetical protein
MREDEQERQRREELARRLADRVRRTRSNPRGRSSIRLTALAFSERRGAPLDSGKLIDAHRELQEVLDFFARLEAELAADGGRDPGAVLARVGLAGRARQASDVRAQRPRLATLPPALPRRPEITSRPVLGSGAIPPNLDMTHFTRGSVRPTEAPRPSEPALHPAVNQSGRPRFQPSSCCSCSFMEDGCARSSLLLAWRSCCGEGGSCITSSTSLVRSMFGLRSASSRGVVRGTSETMNPLDERIASHRCSM